MKTNRRNGYDKWFKYNLMKNDSQLAAHVPETHLFSKRDFFQMLDAYKEAIIKPVVGSFGHGVMKISEMSDGIFELHHGNKKISIAGRSKIYEYVNQKAVANGKRHLIQYLIPLASVNGNPIDFRTIVQRKSGSRNWIVTGKHAKVAGDGYFVTNLKNNGMLLPTETALFQSNVADLNMAKAIAELDQLSVQAARCLSRTFAHHRIWGLDVGIDTDGKLWIIEPNYSPRVNGFRRLPDHTMFNTIHAYMK